MALINYQGFTSLSSTSWDALTENNSRTLQLDSNKSITISNIPFNFWGFLHVKQDTTGLRTITVNGTSITIKTPANAETMIGILNVGGVLKFYPEGSGGSSSDAITPPAPTSGVVDDTADTFAYTLSVGYALSEHEYTLDGGSTWSAATNPISVGNVSKAIGQVGVRVKAATGRNASATLYNATAFNAATESSTAILFNHLWATSLTGDIYSFSTYMTSKAADSARYMSGNGFIRFQVDALTVVVGLDDAPNLNNWSASGLFSWRFAAYVTGGIIYAGVRNQASDSPINLGAVSGITHLEIRRTGTTVTLNKSTDGFNYFPLHTYSASSSEELYIKTNKGTAATTLNAPSGNGFTAVAQSILSTYSAVTYPTTSVVNNDNGILTTLAATTGYGNTALSGVKLPSGVDGAVGFKWLTGDGDAMFGLSTTNAQQGYASFNCAVWVDPTTGNLYTIDGAGSGTGTNRGALTDGTYVLIQRTGSVIKVVKSTDGTTWTDVVTLTYSSTADLYPVVDIFGAAGSFQPGIIHYPQGKNLA